MNEPTDNQEKSPALALILGFLPAPLAFFWLPAALLGADYPSHFHRAMLLVACLFSVFCCFTSSFMLFARRTGQAIMGGILFLILNGVIAFFFGCTAIVKH